MWWIPTLFIIGAMGYYVYVATSDTRCPYCQKWFTKRLIASEPVNNTIAHFLLDVKEEKNNYVCTACSQDWWIEGERQSRSRRFIFSILAYLDSDDPGKAFVKRQSYHLGSYVRAFGRSDTLIGAFFGATIILLISLQERLVYSVLFMALVIIAPLSGVFLWIVRRLDFLPANAYRVISRVIIGGFVGGLFTYMLLSLFKLVPI